MNKIKILRTTKNYNYLHIALFATIFSLTISLNFCIAQNDKVFFGNLHSHTSYSDGSGTPDDAYRHAKFTGNLDFLAITEHNHRWAENSAGERRDGILIATNHDLYNGTDNQSLISTANRWTENGSFVAIYGQEVSSIGKGNHVNVFNAPEVITISNGKFDDLISWLDQVSQNMSQKPILQFNHPKLYNDNASEYGADDFSSPSTWIETMDRYAQLIEIINGPAMTKLRDQEPAEVMQSDYLYYLNLGFHLAPTADQDNHYFTWGTSTRARTGVIAESLTNDNIYNALRNRHVYATEDNNLRVIFHVNGKLCGTRITALPNINTELDIKYSITDDDEPDARYRVEIFSDQIGGDKKAQIIDQVFVEGDTQNGTISDINYIGGHQYIFFKVIQIDEDGNDDRAWTSPVWFEPNTSPDLLTDSSDQFVASKRSHVFHLSLTCIDAQRIKDSNKIIGSDAKSGRRQHIGCPRN